MSRKCDLTESTHSTAVINTQSAVPPSQTRQEPRVGANEGLEDVMTDDHRSNQQGSITVHLFVSACTFSSMG